MEHRSEELDIFSCLIIKINGLSYSSHPSFCKENELVPIYKRLTIKLIQVFDNNETINASLMNEEKNKIVYSYSICC